MASVTINGVSYVGNSISISDDKVVIDGVVQAALQTDRIVNVALNGDVENLKLTSGSVKVAGNAGSVSTTSGDITCMDVGGSVSTVSGNVTARNISGKVSTVSGDISGT